MSWFYNNKIFNEADLESDIIGMVYLITNLTNGRKYVGKKKFIRTYKTKATKKKRAKRVYTQSDWREYYSSSRYLLEDIEILGKANFKREILHLCKSLGEMSYLEVTEQIQRGVLLDENYYNGIIQCRINAKHLKCHTK